MARWLYIGADRPRTVITGHLLLLLLAGLAASRISVEGSVEAILPADSPEVRFAEAARRAFGSADGATVAVIGSDVLRPQTLARIDRLTRELARLPGVERVMSLTNARDPARDALDPPRLVPRVPLSLEEAASVKQRLQEVPLYRRALVSEDLSAAAIHVFFHNLSDREHARLGIEEKIGALVLAERGDDIVVWSGPSRLKRAAVRTMRRDLLVLTPAAGAAIAVIFFLVFGSIPQVLLLLAAAGAGVVWTLALMVAFGRSLTLGTFVLPPLLLVVGSSYAIHYRMACRGTGAAAARAGLSTVLLPVWISAATTAVGFGSLATSSMRAIADLGWFSVGGIFFSALITLTLMPAGLALAPGASPRALHSKPLPVRILRTWARSVFRRRGIWLAVWVALTAVALLGLPRIRADADFLSYFDPNSAVRTDTERIHQALGGTQAFHVVVAGERPGTIERWDILQRMRDLQRRLEELPGVTLTASLADYLELLGEGLAVGGGADLVIDEKGNLVPAKTSNSVWEDPATLRQALAIVKSSPDTFRHVVTRDFSWGAMLVRTTRVGSRDTEQLLNFIRAWANRHFPREVRVLPTGNVVLLTGSSSDVVTGQVRSLSLALALIFAAMTALFLSVRVGLLAMIPNVVPVALFFGILARIIHKTR